MLYETVHTEHVYEMSNSERKKMQYRNKIFRFYSEEKKVFIESNQTSLAVSELMVTKHLSVFPVLSRPLEISQPCSDLIRGHSKSACRILEPLYFHVALCSNFFFNFVWFCLLFGQSHSITLPLSRLWISFWF